MLTQSVHGNNDEERNDNGRQYLEQYGLTDNAQTSLNLFLQGYKIATGITEFSKGLVENWSLTSVELRKQDIGKDGAVALGQALKQNRYLRYLGMGRNKLCNEGCVAVMEGLRMNQTLEYLDLEWNEIRDDGAVAIGEMLKYNTSLQSLVLERNKIKGKGAVAVADALKQNEKLHNLNIGYNKIMNAGAEAFAAALMVNEALITLSVYLNEIRKDGGIALAQALAKNNTLQSINLQSNRIGSAVSEWAELPKTNNTLREINLQNTMIDEECAYKLGDGFRNNQSIMSLNLSKNQIGNRGMKALLSGLKGKTALRYLDISGTGLEGVDAVGDLCELIELGGNLQVLQLDDNDLGKKGIVMLCTRLERNVVLHSINLDRAGVKREGAIALSVALRKKSYWLSLSIAGNKIGSDGIKNICLALRDLNTLTELDFSDNDITNVCEDALYRVLQANQNLAFIRLKGNEIARDIPSGVLTRALAEQLVAVSGALTSGGESQDVSNPDGTAAPANAFLPTLNSTTPHLNASLGKGNAYHPSVNFAVNNRHAYTGSYDPTQPPPAGTTPTPTAASPQPGRKLTPPLPTSTNRGGGATQITHTAGTTLSNHTVSLPKALSPTFQPSMVPYKSPVRPGLSPVNYTGALSPVKNTHTPGTLKRLECNIGKLMITEDQLRRKFNQLDRNGNGWLDKYEFMAIYREFENYGVDATDEKVLGIIDKHKMIDDGKITFDEFCIIMLSVVQR